MISLFRKEKRINKNDLFINLDQDKKLEFIKYFLIDLIDNNEILSEDDIVMYKLLIRLNSKSVKKNI